MARGDRIEFEVLEEVKVGNTVVIPKGGIAWGKDGYKDWARKLAVTSGTLNIDADLETVAAPAVKSQQPQ